MRLPPPAMRCPASSGMSATLLCIRSRITALTPFMSLATSAIKGSSEGSRAPMRLWIVAATAPPYRAAAAFPSRLPDVDALVGRKVHLVAGLHVEGLVPGVDVPD